MSILSFFRRVPSKRACVYILAAIFPARNINKATQRGPRASWAVIKFTARNIVLESM